MSSRARVPRPGGRGRATFDHQTHHDLRSVTDRGLKPKAELVERALKRQTGQPGHPPPTDGGLDEKSV
jgi:hypothetical protein